MNVLYLTNNPNLGSTARILQSWLLRGPELGINGIVALPQPGALVDWLAANRVTHRVGPMPWPNARWPLPGLWHAWVVARWARRHRVEVIHCNEHDTYPFARLVRQFLPRPVVCHVRFRIDRGFGEWAFGRGRGPDYLLWTSHQQKQDSAAAVDGLIPEERQSVLHLGLDLNTFGTLAAGREETRRAWGFRPEEVVIGTASALRPIKRLGDFIDMVARLAREDARVVGVMAGDAMPGDEGHRDDLLRRIEATGLGRRFRWVGHLEPVEPLYHASDVFVSTSEYETFGNSVCEAMACRRPVAGYAGGSVPEVVGPTGRMVPVGDLDGLTAVVRELVRSPALRTDLGTQGRERVAAEFNPIRSLKFVRSLYYDLVGGPVRLAPGEQHVC